MYHYIRNFDKDFPFFNFLHQKDFIKQNNFLLKKKDFIHLDESLDLNFSEKKFLLTFDDGLKEHLKIAKFLKKRKIMGLFFIPSLPLEKSDFLSIHKIHLIFGKYTSDEIISFFKKFNLKFNYNRNVFSIFKKQILFLNNKTTYALEGSIFIAGAGVQWLRDKIKLINNAYETEKIARSKKNNQGIYLVPAFTGLGAPYWSPNSRGLITGLTRNTDWKDLVRAVVESVAYQSFDLFESMRKDGLRPKIVKVDGGMVANNWFSQFLSDILNIKVIRSKTEETTALGVAFMAGYQVGVYKSLGHIKSKWKKRRDFTPKLNKTYRNKLLQGWKQAIRKTLA